MADIALFGTSADPPTRGHQALLTGLLEHYPRVATWASDNPMKQHAADLSMRRALLQALVQHIADPRLELAQELSSPYAITTLEHARNRWPGQRFCFVVGSDLAAQIPSWKNSRDWLSHCDLGIVPRAGWPLADSALNALNTLGARLRVLPLSIPGTASSKVRQAGERDQVPESLTPLLLKHNLYGYSLPTA